MIFFEKNKWQLTIISGIIVLAILVTLYNRDIMNWVSVMISVPSFFMSFIVLNKFNVESDLGLALKAERERELVEQREKKKFSDYYDENFTEVKNSLSDIKKYYSIQIKHKSDNQISQAMVVNAKKSLGKYREFVSGTKDYVKLSLSSQEIAETITNHESPYPMKSQDIATLIEQLDDIDDNYFLELRQLATKYESQLDKDQLEKLKEVFIDIESFSNKYLEVVDKVYSTVEHKEG